MANFFKNPLVLAETVVGSIIDQRAVVLYEQPKEITLLDAGSDGEGILQNLVDKNALKELFTGIEVPYISKINGFNAYGISYMEADVDISSEVCDHPTETGSLITDYSYIKPMTIKVQIAVPTAWYTRIYTQIKKIFTEKTYVMVQTKMALYRNMIIAAMPYKMEQKTIDRPIIELQLRQILEAKPRYIDKTNEITQAVTPSDNDTQDLGNLTANTSSEVFLDETN